MCEWRNRDQGRELDAGLAGSGVSRFGELILVRLQIWPSVVLSTCTPVNKAGIAKTPNVSSALLSSIQGNQTQWRLFLELFTVWGSEAYASNNIHNF